MILIENDDIPLVAENNEDAVYLEHPPRETLKQPISTLSSTAITRSALSPPAPPSLPPPPD